MAAFSSYKLIKITVSSCHMIARAVMIHNDQCILFVTGEEVHPCVVHSARRVKKMAGLHFLYIELFTDVCHVYSISFLLQFVYAVW